MKFQKGHKINLGRKCSEDKKKKISIANTGKHIWDKRPNPKGMLGKIPWNKGKKMSDDFKNKARNRQTGKYWSLDSRLKMSKSLKGEKSHYWRGGITKEHDKIRNSLEIKLWKKAVLERDRFTCAKTNKIGGKLVVHHINNFADFPELRTSIENGITFAKESHELFHKIYGKRNNTKEQLLEFLET